MLAELNGKSSNLKEDFRDGRPSLRHLPGQAVSTGARCFATSNRQSAWAANGLAAPAFAWANLMNGAHRLSVGPVPSVSNTCWSVWCQFQAARLDHEFMRSGVVVNTSSKP
jgi:hypothetical protein